MQQIDALSLLRLWTSRDGFNQQLTRVLTRASVCVPVCVFKITVVSGCKDQSELTKKNGLEEGQRAIILSSPNSLDISSRGRDETFV